MSNLSVMDVEEILLKIKRLENNIDCQKEKYSQSASFYQQCLDNAKKIFEQETKDDRIEIEELKLKLQSYFDDNPPTGKRKSLKFAGGSFGYSKNSTKFFLNGLECNADNKELLDFCKNSSKPFCKVKQYVDWANLKKNLDFKNPDCVFFADTGEVISGLRAQPAFSVKTI